MLGKCWRMFVMFLCFLCIVVFFLSALVMSGKFGNFCVILNYYWATHESVASFIPATEGMGASLHPPALRYLISKYVMKPVSGFKPDMATGHDTTIWYFEIGSWGNWAQICPDQSPYQVLAENHENYEHLQKITKTLTFLNWIAAKIMKKFKK